MIVLYIALDILIKKYAVSKNNNNNNENSSHIICAESKSFAIFA